MVGDSEKRLWTVCKCVLGPSMRPEVVPFPPPIWHLRGPKWSWASLYPPPAETEGQMDKTRKLLGQNTRESGGVRGGAERQGVPQPHIREPHGVSGTLHWDVWEGGGMAEIIDHSYSLPRFPRLL